MLQVHSFVFNAFQENTYIVYQEKGECAIFDPGMSNAEEENALVAYITEQQLTPTALYNTHCHVDHVLGNHFIHEQYGLLPQMHEGEVPVLVAVQNIAPAYGFRYEVSPIPETFLVEGDRVQIGSYDFQILFVPGHSPAHIAFYCADQKILICGDVLFRGSIGRTDLPGGNHELLLKNIKSKVYTLDPETTVYPGHGPSTNVGVEKQTNPFIRA
ncbi:MAG: MBL fold metallo-hydrolase [Sphingobacterium sp.]|uniref:MBL fold metallo-hydrolase n=1 Tax=Sphingobacterium sp. JB170 TaxID=1434842 RepID=UPI00097F41FC|nr:MBL fold metallo-hydrolase [Sphingobacterium sp. JB170]SJN41953.1 Hydroxyacylglutathione hydrolase [Sphingobacterium sp. JB170]